MSRRWILWILLACRQGDTHQKKIQCLKSGVFMSIGKELSKVRRKKGLNIKMVEEATKIRAKFIEALEKDDYENLPEPVYIKGFIRTYSTFLGINSFKLINKYQSIISPKIENKPTKDEIKSQEKTQSKAKGCVVEPIINQSHLIKLKKKSFPLIAYMLASLITVILILGFFGSLSSAKKPTAKTTAKTKPTQQKNIKKNNLPNKKPKIDGFYINVVASRRVWLKIKKDGSLYFVGFIKPKKKINIHAARDVDILTVNGSALKIYKNQKYLGILSKSKGPSRKIFLKTKSKR